MGYVEEVQLVFIITVDRSDLVKLLLLPGSARAIYYVYMVSRAYLIYAISPCSIQPPRFWRRPRRPPSSAALESFLLVLGFIALQVGISALFV